MTMVRHAQSMLGKHHFIVDGAFMLLVAGSVVFIQRVYCVLQPPPLNAPLSITLAVLAMVPSTRRWLVLAAAFTCIAATMVAFGTFDRTVGMNTASVASIVAVFSSAAYGGRRRNLACAGSILAFNCGLMYKLLFSVDAVLPSSATLFNIAGLTWNLAAFLATWWFGSALRMSRERTSPLRANTDLLVSGRGRDRLRTVLDGCIRIVRTTGRAFVHGVGVARRQAGKARQFAGDYAERALVCLSLIEI